jgi:hypothetical protein
VTTIAGNSGSGATHDGVGTSATVSVYALTLDQPRNKIYFMESSLSSGKLRKMDLISRNVTTILTGTSLTTSITVDNDGKYVYFPSQYTLYQANVDMAPYTKKSILAVAGYSGYVDGQGTNVKFQVLEGLWTNPSGVIYATDFAAGASDSVTSNVIRRIVPSTFTASTISGSGSNLTSIGYSDGYGTQAHFYFPYGIVANPSTGMMYLSDNYNCRIRAIQTGSLSLFILEYLIWCRLSEWILSSN